MSGGQIVSCVNGEKVCVPENEFLNALCSGIADTGYDYWFSGESRGDDTLVFEFISIKAPKIELIVHGSITE